MANVICELPWPPSTNAAWRSPPGVKHVLVSKEYRTFKKAVGDCVLEQKIRRFWTQDRLSIGLLCRPPDMRFFDIDNRVKTTLDALAGAGVIDNDKMIDLIIVARGPTDPPKGSIWVRIEEASSMPMNLECAAWFWPARKPASTSTGNWRDTPRRLSISSIEEITDATHANAADAS